MSLIQDALKRKTEDQHSRPGAPPPVQLVPPRPPKKVLTPPAPEPVIAIPPKNTSARKLFIILAVAIVLILLVIGSSVYVILNRPEPVTEPATQPVPEVIAPAAVPTPAPVPEPEKKPAPKPKVKWPELNFSGSAVGGNQILAIINGRMLSIGDRIKGAKVLQIGKTEVRVEFEGETRVLHIDDE